jgi:hypothetical protein
MKLTFTPTKLTPQDEGYFYYEVTKSEHSGFVLTKWSKAKKTDAKKPYTGRSLFYASLDQVANKLAWENVSGTNLDEVIVSLSVTAENIAKTLKGV